MNLNYHYMLLNCLIILIFLTKCSKCTMYHVILNMYPLGARRYAEKGESVTFSCKATMQGTIEWKYENDTSIINHFDNMKRPYTLKIQETNGELWSNFTILQVQEEDSGIYFCTFDILNKMQELSIVQVHPLFSECGNTTTVKYTTSAVQYDHVKLLCLIPKPIEGLITWMFGYAHINTNMESSSGEKYKLQYSLAGNGLVWYNLTIADVRIEDSGEYRCRSTVEGNNNPFEHEYINVVQFIVTTMESPMSCVIN